MAIVMFALSLTVCEVLTKQEKCKNYDLENEGQGAEEWELHYMTGNV